MNDGIPITVMQIGRNENVAHRTIADLNRMFALLSDEGLLPNGFFRPVCYDSLVTKDSVDLVRDLIHLVMGDDIQASIHIRGRMFSDLTRPAIASADGFARVIRLFAENNELACSLNDEDFDRIFHQAAILRERASSTGTLDPPDLAWLPVKYRPRLDGMHAVSDVSFRQAGSCTLLCPTSYYYQLVWHECLHLLFGLRDCYKPITHGPTCTLRNCVMQWKPALCDPEQGRWFCDKQKEGIRRGVQRLAGKREQLCRQYVSSKQ